MKEDKVTSHESFGMAMFSRINSSGSHPLFGSSIGHNNTIEFTISRAELIRSDLSYDSYFPREELIKIEMSASQFSELITTMNYGSGVPVTLRRVNGERMENPPVGNKRNEHSKEFKEKMTKFANRISNNVVRLKTLLEKQKLSKEDKNEMNSMFGNLITEIKSNIPFYENMFQEQMDKTVSEAKAEVESFITKVINETGLTALKNQEGDNDIMLNE